MLEPDASQHAEQRSGWHAAWRPAVFCIAAFALVMAYAFFRHDLSPHALADRADALRQYGNDHPWRLAFIAFGIFAASVGLSIPYASILLSLWCGWMFGFWKGVLLASLGVTAGDTLAFWISRYLLRDAISHHFEHLMSAADELLDKEGAVYLLSLRLVHVIPAWLINLLMGWTTIRAITFWWATQLGTLPATALYAYVGAQFKSLHELARHGGAWSLLTPWHVAVFVMLAIVPLAARWTYLKVRAKRDGSRE
jgi:uncharacterized membrane protein YdjX (TVP38/TMEM64 family)